MSRRESAAAQGRPSFDECGFRPADTPCECGFEDEHHYFAVLPRNRRQACWWWLRLRFQWHYWRQTRLLCPLTEWRLNRG